MEQLTVNIYKDTYTFIKKVYSFIKIKQMHLRYLKDDLML